MTSLDDYFDGKPDARAVFDVVQRVVEACGPSELSVGSQISFGAARKFAWVWLYNVTRANPNGVVHLMLAIGEPVVDPGVRNVSQIGKRRWNHQIVVRTLADAESAWLAGLIARAYAYGLG